MKKHTLIILTAVFLLSLNGCASAIPDGTTEVTSKQSTSDIDEELQHMTDPNTSFTIAWFSDIQGYSESRPDISLTMADWIVEHAEELNIKYTIVTGDLVNNYDEEPEWNNADQALSRVMESLPLFVVAGNHDINHSNQRYTAYLSRFGQARFQDLPSVGGFYEGGQGRYAFLYVNGKSILLLSVGYGMDEDGIAWMNEILGQYPDYTAILCLHSYLDPSGEYSTDGETLFPEVVEQNPNVRLVLCGHRHGVNHRHSVIDDDKDGMPDRTVYELVADYQEEEDYGSGYLCLLTFNTQEDTMTVTSYSPYLDDYNYFQDDLGIENFTVTLPLN